MPDSNVIRVAQTAIGVGRANWEIRVVWVAVEKLVIYDDSRRLVVIDCTADDRRCRRIDTIEAGAASSRIVGNIAVGNRENPGICHVYSTAILVGIVVN